MWYEVMNAWVLSAESTVCNFHADTFQFFPRFLFNLFEGFNFIASVRSNEKFGVDSRAYEFMNIYIYFLPLLSFSLSIWTRRLSTARVGKTIYYPSEYWLRKKWHCRRYAINIEEFWIDEIRCECVRWGLAAWHGSFFFFPIDTSSKLASNSLEFPYVARKMRGGGSTHSPPNIASLHPLNVAGRQSAVANTFVTREMQYEALTVTLVFRCSRDDNNFTFVSLVKEHNIKINFVLENLIRDVIRLRNDIFCLFV